jgi:ATP synthase protein I
VAQPLLPEPPERPEPPEPHEAHERPHLAEPVGNSHPAEPEEGALAEERALPEERALLPEPPERPVTGMRRVPAFRGRRPAASGDAGQDLDTWAGKYASGQAAPLPSRGAGWTMLSYLIAGMIAYGGIGWLVGRAVHQTVIFPVGMLFGLGISLGLVIYRYGRSSSTQNEHAKETLREEPAGDR